MTFASTTSLLRSVALVASTKLTAKLRAVKTDRNPLLLKVNFGAGRAPVALVWMLALAGATITPIAV